jgi:Tfp pilus assembly protein PilX
MVEARGVVLMTVLAALVLLGLLAFAASSFSPDAIREQACRSDRLPASDCS